MRSRNNPKPTILHDRTESIRLNRFLAMVGVASRRDCDDIIAAGRVVVDGKRVTSPGVRVLPGVNKVAVDKVPIQTPTRPVVLILNKPTGVVSTADDPDGRRTVIDLCRHYAKRRRLYPIGRLDINTTGLLLLTNDGMLCYRLTHPRFEVPRTYHVRVRGIVDSRRVERLSRQFGRSSRPGAGGQRRSRHGSRRRDRSGVPASAPEAKVELVKEMGKESIIRITLYEGRNRQVRRLCETVGLRVISLKRVKFGPLSVRGVPSGAVRPLEARELDRLYKFVS